jgi:hypothetical protein
MHFDEVVELRVQRIKSILKNKAEEYATEDRFHNFRVAGRMDNESPERALWGMLKKHIVSVRDMIDWVDKFPEKLNVPIIQEKIGDSINYFILLEGLLYERLEKK